MTGRALHPFYRAAFLGAAFFAGFTTGPVQASEVPFPQKTVALAPNGQPVADIIKDLFGQAGLNVKVSTKVQGRAAGRWVNPPAEIWKQLAKAYNLVAYYDGAVVRVYHADEIASRNFTTASPDLVVSSAKKMRLTNNGNEVRAGQGMVIASGVPEFLMQIAQLASTPPAPPPPAMMPAPPAAVAMGGGIVSPITGAPAARIAGLPAPYKLDYTVSRQASARDPFEIRIYNLKYADAGDRVINLGDRDQIIPGVASLLRQTLGDGQVTGAQVVERGNPQGVSRGSPSEQYDGPAFGPYGPYMPGYQGQPQEDRAPQREVVERAGPRIAVNPSGNSVIVVDRPSMMSTYNAMIEAFDRPKTQIEIEATIIDIDVDQAKELGIDWSFGFSGLGGLFGGQIITPNSRSSGNINAGFFRSDTNFVSARISALSRTGKIQIVSRPRITTKENEPAVTDNRRIIPVRFGGGQFSNGGITNYQVGILMAITPKIAKEPDGLVTSLQIDLRDGALTGYTADGIPFIDNSSLNTNATIRQGESLIIGGITVDSSFDEKSKIPGLGDIPLVGNAFKKRSKGSRRKERIVIITPRILSDLPNTIEGVSDADNADEEEEEEAEPAALPKKRAKRSAGQSRS
ncbi:MAG: secretin N-terminal domain-containing protein [Sphingorhabdus sp.]